MPAIYIICKRLRRSCGAAEWLKSDMTTDDILRRAFKAQAEWKRHNAITMLIEKLRSNPREARLHQILGPLEHSLDKNETAL